ncbi:MAG: YDG domain-containing protein, partial [Verrucomicrobiota bacterium]
ATAVSAGWEHSLALGSDGRLYGWGRNGFGQLGDGSGVNRTSARRVMGLDGLRFSGMAAGRFHSLGLGEDGRGWAWGRNGAGQLGDGTTEESVEPVEVSRGEMTEGVVFVGLSAGWQHSVGLGSDGRAYAWGGNGSGQLGDGTVQEKWEPAAVEGIEAGAGLKAVHAGGQFSVGVGTGGALYAWGANDSGQLGNGGGAGRLEARPVLAGAIPTGLTTGMAGVGSAHVWVMASGPEPLQVPVVLGVVVEGTYGVAMNAAVQVSGSGITTYEATGLPLGLSMDTATGVLTGVPGQVGTFTIQLTARNAAGAGTGVALVRVVPKSVGVTGIVVRTKVYDGSTTATWSGSLMLDGVVGGDVVSVTGQPTASFASKQAGTGKAVTVTGLGIGGADAPKYLLAPTLVTGEVQPRTLGLSGLVALRKTYDGSPSATFDGVGLTGVVAGDDVGLSGLVQGTFATEAAGVGLGLTLLLPGLNGADAGNYALPLPGALTGTIDARPVTVTGLAAVTRSYDGTLQANLSGTPVLSGVLGGDDVGLAGTAQGEFETATVGEGKRVNVIGLALMGSGALNYELRLPDLTASIQNQAPTWGAMGQVVISELAPWTLTLAAMDADVPAQALSYGLVSGPAGLTMSVEGIVEWTPTEAQGPSTNSVLVAVTDGVASVTNAFTVIVSEVNADPVLATISNRTLDELTPLSLSLSATDVDIPAQSLSYRIVSGPPGMTVNASSGALAWTPTEAQGPSTNTVLVAVTDGVASVTNAFTVIVSEVNADPVLATISNRTLDELTPLSLSLSATDVDIPAQSLSYRIVSGPPGMTVNASSGALAWTPTEA